MIFRSYQRAEDDVWRRALAGQAAAVWQSGETFTVHPCGQDHAGEIVLLVLPLD